MIKRKDVSYSAISLILIWLTYKICNAAELFRCRLFLASYIGLIRTFGASKKTVVK